MQDEYHIIIEFLLNSPESVQNFSLTCKHNNYIVNNVLANMDMSLVKLPFDSHDDYGNYEKKINPLIVRNEADIYRIVDENNYLIVNNGCGEVITKNTVYVPERNPFANSDFHFSKRPAVRIIEALVINKGKVTYNESQGAINTFMRREKFIYRWEISDQDKCKIYMYGDIRYNPHYSVLLRNGDMKYADVRNVYYNMYNLEKMQFITFVDFVKKTCPMKKLYIQE